MDAKEALRRYLEQRREMGESELVLDRMTVEETLAILGVRGGGHATSGSNAGPRESTREREPTPASMRDHDERPMERGQPRRDDAPAGDVDWRQALRAAGAAPETMPKKTTSRPEPAEPPAPPAREIEPAPVAASASPTRAAATPTHVSPIADVPAGLSVGSVDVDIFGGELSSLDTLDKIAKHVASCTRCPLYSTATNPVPGEGNPNADFMCVGEAPGATEDETGRPFIGAAGQLLTKILAAINLNREDVYIANVLKHRPPGNRNPKPEEVMACSPYLIRQIELIRPKVILALGTFAAQTLLDTKLSIGKLRGQVHRYYGVPLIVTYHPAALLRNPGWKRPTWEDVQLAHRILTSATAPESGA